MSKDIQTNIQIEKHFKEENMGNATSNFALYPEMSFNVSHLNAIFDHEINTLEEYCYNHVGLQFYGQSSQRDVSKAIVYLD